MWLVRFQISDVLIKYKIQSSFKEGKHLNSFLYWSNAEMITFEWISK